MAIANTIGGRIPLGVRDDGTMAGVNDSNNLGARQEIARNCDPSVKVIDTRGYEGLRVPTIANGERVYD